MDKRTLRDSGIQTIILRTVSLAHTEAGKNMILSASVLPDIGEITRELLITDETRQLLNEGYSLNFSDYMDCGVLLQRAEKHGVLSAEEMLNIARVMRITVEARAILNAGRLRAPALYDELGDLPDLEELTDLIEGTFDEKGQIRDEASPVLGGLRKRTRDIRNAINNRLDSMLKDVKVRVVLQDSFVTLREARYVLPVKASHSPEVPGIIHGLSNSGQTAFIEPEYVVKLNNSLIVAQEAVRLEELHVLRGRTRALLRQSEGVRRGSSVLPRLDALIAKARLAMQMHANRPTVVEKGKIDLRQARNPLLVLHRLDRQKTGHTPVIANDISLPGEKNIMVISGPNAGGKSVSLQTVAMACLMSYMGFLVTADEASIIPFYNGVYTMLGDSAALNDEVSTFTGQLKRVSEIFDAAKGNPRVLALLDELGTGTEPRKGQALAVAIVKTLADIGVHTMVATHYDMLKQLGEEDPRFMNARMGVDRDYRPTYKLEPGRTGESNPFEIARQVGFPDETVKLAESMISRREQELDKALSQATVLRDALQKENSRVEILKTELTDLKKRYTIALQKVRQRADVMVAQARRDALEEIRRVSEEVKMIEKDVKKQSTVRRRRKRLQEVKDEIETKIEKEKPVSKKQGKLLNLDKLKPGNMVMVTYMNQTGTALEVDIRRNRVMVAISGVRMWIKQADLAKPPEVEKEKPDKPIKKTEEPTAIDRDKPVELTSSNTLKLVGLRMDDALSELDKGLDNAFLKEDKVLGIVHGIGTSTLKKAVRAYLRASSYPLNFRPGLDAEGGEAVTIVFFN